MAPRGRPRKKDNRMDAAIRTMQTEYGISDVELIKKVVNQLLVEYGGGDEAWYFIELYTYNVLFEEIVRHRDQEEKILMLKSAGEGDSGEDNSSMVATAPVNAAGSSSIPICSEVVDRGLLEYKEDTYLLPSTEMDGKGWKDIGLDLSSSQGDSSNADSAPVRRRRPCYGWIEDDEEEDIDSFIDLKPAKPKTRRRSRWDLSPADP